MSTGRGWGRVFGRLPRMPSFLPKVVRAEEHPPAPASEIPEPLGAKASEDPPAIQFELFNREWQNISQQDNFDGFRLEAGNAVTKHLQAAHTLFLGTQLRECGYIYQFGPAFQSEDQRTMLVARAGLDGGVNGRVIQKVGSNFEIKGSSHSHLKEPMRNMHEGAIEYNGKEATAAAKLAWQGAWLLGGAYTSRITPSLQLGCDLTLIAVSSGAQSIGQVGLRWAAGRDIFTASLSRTPDPKSPGGGNLHECRLAYVRRLGERLSLGTEFKYSHPDKESGLQMAYEYTFRQARVQGLLDTDGRVSCCVSEFTGFGFSGMIDYSRGDYKFGVVMHVFPQPEPGQQPM